MPAHKTHGKSRGKDGKHSQLYQLWANVKYRCTNPNAKDYPRYGGRGISICPEWENNFEAFNNWAIENGYQRNYQLDREDNSKGYSPQNCRWVTPKVNSNNRRNSIVTTYDGKTTTVLELSNLYSIPLVTLYRHFNKGDLTKYIDLRRSGNDLRGKRQQNHYRKTQ